MTIALTACWFLAAPVCPPVNAGPMVTGWLSQYGEAPTVGTIAYRQSVGDLPLDLSRFDGFIATADCGLIGSTAWLSINGGRLEYVIVFDCAGHAETYEWMTTNRVIAEVDYWMAERYGLDGGVEALLFWSG